MNIKLEYNTAMADAERRLRKGLLTLCEYREIEDALKRLYFDREIVETISARVEQFVSLFGIHTSAHGVGWKMVLLPFKNKEAMKEWTK